jgi:hypothetical protein
MSNFDTFRAFLAWLATPAGLALAVVALVALAKRIPAIPVGRRRTSLVPRQVDIGRWVADHATLASIAIAAVLAFGGLAVQRLDLGRFVEPYWPTVVLVWAVSQAIYNGQKAGVRAMHLSRGASPE